MTLWKTAVLTYLNPSLLRVKLCCLEMSFTPLILTMTKSFPLANWLTDLAWDVWIFLFFALILNYLLLVMSVRSLLSSVLFNEFLWGSDHIGFALSLIFELELALYFVHDGLLIFLTFLHDVLEDVLLSWIDEKFTLAPSWERVVVLSLPSRVIMLRNYGNLVLLFCKIL